jgi:hypothetical protein
VQSGTARWSSARYAVHLAKVNTMLKETRSRLIQVWFAGVALVSVAGTAFGASVTVRMGATLLLVSLVPLAVALFLWPGNATQTVAEVLHDVDQRGT